MRPASVPLHPDQPRPRARAWRLLVGDPDAPAIERFAIAMLLSVLALLVALLLRREHLGVRAVVYIAAVAVSTLRGGAAPGLAAAAVCAAGLALSGEGAPLAWLEQPAPVHRWLFFLGSAALTVWAGVALREGYRQVQARRRRAEASAHTHRVAAELGVRALAEGDLGALLHDTVGAVRRGLGCDSVTFLELQPGGEALRLRDTAGVGSELLGAAFTREQAPLAFRALEAREPIAIDDLRAERDLASPVLLEHAIASSLVAPIVAPGPGGRSFGVLGAHWISPRLCTADDGTFLQTAANVVGTAVVRLAADERVRRMLARERFLAEASRQLALSIDWQQTLGRVARLALPYLGDWCLVVLADPPASPRAVVAEASDPRRAAAVQELLGRYPIDLGAAHGVGRMLRIGEAELIAEVTPDQFVRERNAEADVRRELLVRLGMLSYVGAPLRIGGKVLGAIGFGIAEGTRRYGPEDLEVARELAQRCAVALENASLYRAAQEATRAREQVLAVVSHDLKAPLGAMLMGARVVERLAPPAGQDLRRAAVTVRRTAERMRRLVHDLVDVASIDSGALSIHPAETDAQSIATEAVESVRSIAEERGIVVAVDVDELPPVHCDRDRVLQVIDNLLSNAMQVSEGGGTISVRVWSTGEEVVFRVADRGPGIPAEDLPHLFERWYRGSARYPGSGLGLTIAKTIVSAHGGSIWAESKQGEGAAFSFALPRSFGTAGAGAR